MAPKAAIKRNALRQLDFDPETDTERLDFFFSPFDTIDFYKAFDLRVREGDSQSAQQSLARVFKTHLSFPSCKHLKNGEDRERFFS